MDMENNEKIGATDLNSVMQAYMSWTKRAFTANSYGSASRPWCMLGFPNDKELSQETLREFFDRKKLNDEYVKRYKESDPRTKKPVAYLKTEANLVYGFHKGMIARHKSRLQAYRDDCSQKNYHTWNTIMQAHGKFIAERNTAEGSINYKS